MNNYLRLFRRLFLIIFLVVLYTPLLFLILAAFAEESYLSTGISSVSSAFEHFVGKAVLYDRTHRVLVDSELRNSFWQSLLTSTCCATAVAFTAWIAGYVFTRITNKWVKFSLPISLSTYIFPPATLAIGIADNQLLDTLITVKIQIFLGHYLYLFPLAFVLAIGFWMQKPTFLDRIAASDGLGFFHRILVHMGRQEISRFCVIAILVFMVSWGDIVFSRVLGSINNTDRLLADLVFQRLFADQDSGSYGAFSLFSIFIISIASFFSLVLSFVLDQENKLD